MPFFVMPGSGPHPQATQLEMAARSLIGVRFRPQGRDRNGCDCLGLALQTAWGGGVRIDMPPQPLRGLSARDGAVLLGGLGCRPVASPAAGDLLLQVPATLQLHLVVLVCGGVVEAHAGLRRVVFRPLRAGEQWHSAWRLPMGDG